MTAQFRLSGTAIPADAKQMLEEIAEHFAEHASVTRVGEAVHLEHEIGAADISIADGTLAIELASNSEDELTMIRTVLAEHLFHFAGEEKFELTWSEKPKPALPGNMRLATVTGTRNVTPHMRRVTFSCPDVQDFEKGGLHVRLLLPQNGEAPVWPTVGDDGRVQWPDEKITAVRIYTIRSVDAERGEVDIVGTIIGVVDRGALIDGSQITEGNVLIGLPSSGLHTNGYSLARRALEPFDWNTAPEGFDTTLGEALLAPHRCYIPEVRALQTAGIELRGLAHITGGGIVENVPRILPDGMDAVIQRGTWAEPPLFGLIQDAANVSDAEMFRVFNMGIGMIAVIPAAQCEAAVSAVSDAVVIGSITSGSKSAVIV